MTRAVPVTPTVGRGARLLLVLAAVSVGFAAADTYVVVLALPDMMTTAGLSIDELQRAAPIVSGFLLGYVAMLPLVGRIADLRGRVPVLVGSLVVFAIGSAVTAASYDLGSMVVGRFVQGVGGGGLVPATLALVADLYPPKRRGLPLGIVSAVQELGSVVGPLFGAVVLSLSRWQTIFWINLAAGLVLAAALRVVGRSEAVTDPPADDPSAGPAATRARGAPDVLSVGLLVLGVVAGLLVLRQPQALVTDVTLGLPFVPFAGSSRWFSPLALVAATALVLVLVRGAAARSPLVPVRSWWATARQADLPGGAWLGLALAGIVLAFASADPEKAVFSPAGRWWLLVSLVATVGLVWHLRRAEEPLFAPDTFRARAAWGSLVVSFLIGVSLIAALVDVPLFARVTTYPDSQLGAALVLLRLLVALPVGAVIGGLLLRRVGPGPITAVGMALTSGGFMLMSQWGLTTLDDVWVSSVPLVLAGLGFGLALAPVNDALLAATAPAVHGVASAFVVVARMIGMLVGISALTTIGLRLYYAELGSIPSPRDVCGTSTSCQAYTDLLKEAGLVQLDAVFVGAAISAGLAAVLALVLLRRAGS